MEAGDQEYVDICAEDLASLLRVGGWKVRKEQLLDFVRRHPFDHDRPKVYEPELKQLGIEHEEPRRYGEHIDDAIDKSFLDGGYWLRHEDAVMLARRGGPIHPLDETAKKYNFPTIEEAAPRMAKSREAERLMDEGYAREFRGKVSEKSPEA